MTDPTPRERRLEEALREYARSDVYGARARKALSVKGEAPAPTPSPASLDAFVAAQKDLPPEAEKILRDNLWKLYEGAGSPPSPSPSGGEVLRKAETECKTRDLGWPLSRFQEITIASQIDSALSSLREAMDERVEVARGLADDLQHRLSALEQENSSLRARADKAEADVQNDYRALWEADAADLASAREALRGMLDYAEDVNPELLIAAMHGVDGSAARRAKNQARVAVAEAALSGAPPAPAERCEENYTDDLIRQTHGVAVRCVLSGPHELHISNDDGRKVRWFALAHAPAPVAQEDAPAPERPRRDLSAPDPPPLCYCPDDCKVHPAAEPSPDLEAMWSRANTAMDVVLSHSRAATRPTQAMPGRNSADINGLIARAHPAEPSPDLEGLIRETEQDLRGQPPKMAAILLHEFACEVSRLTREPLEKERYTYKAKLGDWAAGEAMKQLLGGEGLSYVELEAHAAEAERKLSEVTQERDEARLDTDAFALHAARSQEEKAEATRETPDQPAVETDDEVRSRYAKCMEERLSPAGRAELTAREITDGWTGIETLSADGTRRVVIVGSIITDITARIADALKRKA